MEPELGMVKIGGPARQSGLCLRFGSVTAVWAVAVPALGTFAARSGSAFHDLVLGEKVCERTRLRPRGGKDQG